VLRFVEPESGEVAALRPDMTPQIARMVATRLASQPTPIRLCYEGTIVRRRQGGARRHRQVPQAGVELYGVGSIAGDLEILRLTASVARAVGLSRFIIDVGHASVARALLDAMPAELAPDLTDALVHKDAARLDSLLDAAPRPELAPVAAALRALPELSGGGAADANGADVFARAQHALAGTPAEAPLRELHALWHAALAPSPWPGGDLTGLMRVDLGEVRGFAYYTGVIFHVLAEGPGEPIAAGGRYDELLGRFDMPMPAVGFALHLDAVAWALRTAGVPDVSSPRVLVAASPSAAQLAASLRSAGVPCAVHPAGDAAAYARAWGFTHLLTEGPSAEPAGTPTLQLVHVVSEAICAQVSMRDVPAAMQTLVAALAPHHPATDHQP
jgi:ATP phosphoribosyltransferase regulatory subunit